MTPTHTLAAAEVDTDRIGAITAGAPHAIGRDFTARHFSEEMFFGRMDPLLMVDHFVMTGPTFAPHPHAGMSAVTLMFEDAQGGFFNRDTLGKQFTLRAGDLYWLAAAGGAAHEEVPEPGARTHALQIFVNLPPRLKHGPAHSLLVRADDIPVIENEAHRVRVVLGRSGETVGATGTPEPFTLLDVTLKPGGLFAHPLSADEGAWLYVVSGTVTLRSRDDAQAIGEGRATTVRAGEEGFLHLEAEADTPAHAVLMAATPIRETFVKHGPVVMSTMADARRALIDYADGRFGELPVALPSVNTAR